jgi:glucosamine-6-phosphate deaminase
MRRFFASLDTELRIPDAHYHVPHPFRIDEVSEAIAQAGGVDVCYGGVGYHGHVAFNEPPLSRWSRVTVDDLRNSLTRVVTLGADSIVVQSIGSAGGSAARRFRPWRSRWGCGIFWQPARSGSIARGGARHSAVFRIAVAGEVTVDYPATLIQGHPDAVIHTDEATAQPIRFGL